jgi:hypothetical protein
MLKQKKIEKGRAHAIFQVSTSGDLMRVLFWYCDQFAWTPAEDFKENKKAALEDIFSMLKEAGIHVLFKSNIHQKFAVIDKKIT